MGISMGHSSNEESNVVNINDFEHIKELAVGDYMILKVRFRGLTNYGGKKILMYKRSDRQKTNGRELDPHFLENRPSPIARFVPTGEGWDMAVKLAHLLS